MSIQLATKTAQRFTIGGPKAPKTGIEFILSNEADSKAISLYGNGIELLWLDENDGTVNFCTVTQSDQESLPGLEFTEKGTVEVYAD